MNKESASLVIVFGEDDKLGQGKKYLDNKSQFMGPHSKISAIASGIVASYWEPKSEVWFVGGDPTKSNREEATQMEKYTLARFPHLEGRTRSITGLQDTSLQSEKISKLIKELGYENRQVKAVLPLEHVRRAKGHLEANGVRVNKVYEANKTYLSDPIISISSRRRRAQIVKTLYFNKNMQMYFDIMREFGLNVLGKIDNRGLLVRRISEHFRT